MSSNEQNTTKFTANMEVDSPEPNNVNIVFPAVFDCHPEDRNAMLQFGDLDFTSRHQEQPQNDNNNNPDNDPNKVKKPTKSSGKNPQPSVKISQPSVKRPQTRRSQTSSQARGVGNLHAGPKPGKILPKKSSGKLSLPLKSPLNPSRKPKPKNKPANVCKKPATTPNLFQLSGDTQKLLEGSLFTHVANSVSDTNLSQFEPSSSKISLPLSASTPFLDKKDHGGARPKTNLKSRLSIFASDYDPENLDHRVSTGSKEFFDCFTEINSSISDTDIARKGTDLSIQASAFFAWRQQSIWTWPTFSRLVLDLGPKDRGPFAPKWYDGSDHPNSKPALWFCMGYN